MASFRTLLKQVLHLQESTQRTALAFAIGTAIAFSPFYGFHTILVVFFAWVLRLNFIAVMAGNLINNPWTTVPILGATYWTGAMVMGTADTPTFDWQDLSFSSIYTQVLPYAIPFTIGGLILSAIAAALSYPITIYILGKYRRVESIRPNEPLPPPNPLG
ncbi:MAG TPA: DUF2062 domain-containing protein [Nitrospira sp.]